MLLSLPNRIISLADVSEKIAGICWAQEHGILFVSVGDGRIHMYRMNVEGKFSEEIASFGYVLRMCLYMYAP